VHSGAVELRLILDRFSVEVFVNGGEQVLTSTLYTDQSAQGIRFVCDGTAKVELEQHFLKV
jgi:beta-fructofuranosidase